MLDITKKDIKSHRDKPNYPNFHGEIHDEGLTADSVWVQILSATGGQNEEDIDHRGVFCEVFLKGMELELDPQRWENLIRKITRGGYY